MLLPMVGTGYRSDIGEKRSIFPSFASSCVVYFLFFFSARRVPSIYFPMITNRWGGITLHWVEMPAADRPPELDLHISTDFEGSAHCCIKNDVEGGKFASNGIILRTE
ncbi:hypothetical protein TNCT_715871 [Trichonephila clavata]|uniref:Uncharacterized protein n=1 Tax=Trichonephila clavata TaxID=2740835 RepID=A0A8X6GQK2_TRICU|nr:hypothetical protein TNCT_715871 [Trichonephila clavata]